MGSRQGCTIQPTTEATSEELKPAAWVAISKEKRIGVTEVAGFPVVDQGPE